MEDKDKIKGLAKLREEFPANLIGKLPKPSKRQTDDVKKDYRKGIRCTICGGWHHKDVVHLDYVGHAAATDRLLDADPEWSWEPMALDDNSLPKFGADGGLWIKLTVCGVTRLGYGSADGKKGGNAIKEAIGDAIRNAGMRFGIALDLWCKEDLHGDTEDDEEPSEPKEPTSPPEPKLTCPDFIEKIDNLKQDHKTLTAWDKCHFGKAKDALNDTDLKKFRLYLDSRLKDLSPKEEPKPQFITCPNNDQKMPLEDCKASVECNVNCKTYQDAIK